MVTGGVVGISFDSKISNVYSKDITVTGSAYSGGLVGLFYTANPDMLRTSYVSNNLSGVHWGNLIGWAYSPTISYYCYMPEGAYANTFGLNVPQTDIVYTFSDTFAIPSAWNGSDIWGINPGSLPYLKFSKFNDIAFSVPPYTPTKPPVAQVPYFVDIKEHWGQGHIERLAELGLTSGSISKTDGKRYYKPNSNVTRAEFVTFLRSLTEKFQVWEPDDKLLRDNSTTLKIKGCNDVLKNDWYANHVWWAYSNGVTAGDNYKNFNPDKPISRQEATVMAKKVLNKLGVKNSNPYNLFKDDSKIAPWASDSVYFLNNLNIIIGRPSNYFAPLDNLTRAETSVILIKAFDII